MAVVMKIRNLEKFKNELFENITCVNFYGMHLKKGVIIRNIRGEISQNIIAQHKDEAIVCATLNDCITGRFLDTVAIIVNEIGVFFYYNTKDGFEYLTNICFIDCENRMVCQMEVVKTLTRYIYGKGGVYYD